MDGKLSCSYSCDKPSFRKSRLYSESTRNSYKIRFQYKMFVVIGTYIICLTSSACRPRDLRSYFIEKKVDVLIQDVQYWCSRLSVKKYEHAFV